MSTGVILLILGVILAVLVKGIIQARTRTESKLSYFEHKSTFKKPEIEMVNKEAGKDEVIDKESFNQRTE